MKEIEIKDNVYNRSGKLLVAKGVKIQLDEERELRYSELGIMKQIYEHRNNPKEVMFARQHIAKALQTFRQKNLKSKNLSLITQATEILQDIIIDGKNSNVGVYLDILSEEDLSWIYSHSLNVALISLMAAVHFKFATIRSFKFGQSIMIHDIGMTLIPRSILNKTDKLTDVEFSVIRNHPDLGIAIIKELKSDYDTRIILEHHERLDGSGYPRGLKGDEISHEARIVMIADAIDSATTDRPHRPGKTIAEIFDEIRSSPDKYDLDIVNALDEILEY